MQYCSQKCVTYFYGKRLPFKEVHGNIIRCHARNGTEVSKIRSNKGLEWGKIPAILMISQQYDITTSAKNKITITNKKMQISVFFEISSIRANALLFIFSIVSYWSTLLRKDLWCHVFKGSGNSCFVG